MLGLIWAQSENGVIGADGAIPWRLPEDQARFKELTLGGAVLMGRGTWESLPERVRPLPGRRNIVLSSRPDWSAEGAHTAASLDEAVALADGLDVWVMGGESVYREALGRADRLEITEVALHVSGDTRAPELDAGWRVAARRPAEGWLRSRGGLDYRFVTRTRA